MDKIENRRKEYLRKQTLNEQGMLYVGNEKIVVNLIDKRPGGIGIFISPKRKLERLNLKEGVCLSLEIDAGNNKREKVAFEVVHIQSENNGYKVGLKRVDESTLTNMQRNIVSCNS